VQRHKRWTLCATLGFLITSAVLIPFFQPNPWNKYWHSGGQFLLTIDLLFFIAAVFEAGFTCVLWSTLRDVKKIETQEAHRRGSGKR
jgi:uncharacterized membrane protein SpoIIM required for sporulation